MKSAAVMLGESLREAGVLVVVFHGFGLLLPQDRGVSSASVAGAAISLVVGVVLWGYGAVFELEGS